MHLNTIRQTGTTVAHIAALSGRHGQDQGPGHPGYELLRRVAHDLIATGPPPRKVQQIGFDLRSMEVS